MGLQSALSLCIILFILFILSFITSKLVNDKQPIGFIDEIFHIPQAQAYCQHQWSRWDQKITTLPGLYLISYLVLKPLNFVIGTECSVFNLRLSNILATIIIFVTSYLIIKKLKTVRGSFLELISAFNIAICPPLYFFTFLYYTDVWSTAFVLLAYYQHLSNGKILGFIYSCLAVLMRQTNIIWVGFMILDCIWTEVSSNIKKKTPLEMSLMDIFKVLTSYLPLGKDRPPNNDTIIKLLIRVVKEVGHLATVCVGFVIFVFLNGGIVLGDKQAHTPVFHPMQNLYFLLFASFFGLPFFITEAVRSWRVFPSLLKVVLLCAFCTVLSDINKIEHPYLLADNRHLAFYIWKRVLGHRLLRHVIVPGYVFSGAIIYRLLANRGLMFMLSLCFCTFVNLTPQYLFELRYFLLPYIMCRLHFRGTTAVILSTETLLNVIINISVVGLFLTKQFTWESEPGVMQRIIW